MSSRLSRSELSPPRRDGEAEIGERVTVLDLTTSAVCDYQLVDEATGLPTRDEIPISSGLGAALLGRHVGDIVSVECGGRLARLEVVEIDG